MENMVMDKGQYQYTKSSREETHKKYKSKVWEGEREIIRHEKLGRI
jgi:hypothetical protein